MKDAEDSLDVILFGPSTRFFSVALEFFATSPHHLFFFEANDSKVCIKTLYTILTFIPSWNWRIIEMNLSGHPNVFIIAHRPPRQTVSKAFDKLTKVNSRSMFSSWNFFCIRLAAKIMSTVP